MFFIFAISFIYLSKNSNKRRKLLYRKSKLKAKLKRTDIKNYNVQTEINQKSINRFFPSQKKVPF